MNDFPLFNPYLAPILGPTPEPTPPPVVWQRVEEHTGEEECCPEPFLPRDAQSYEDERHEEVHEFINARAPNDPRRA